MTPVTNVSGIGPGLAAILAGKGIKTAEQFVATSAAELTTIPGIGARRAKVLLAAASQVSQATSLKAIPAADKIQTQNLPELAGKKAMAKKDKAKKRALAKKAVEKRKAKEKAAAKEKKAAKRRTKKAVKKKKAKKAAHKMLKEKADKKSAKASKSKKSGKSKKK